MVFEILQQKQEWEVVEPVRFSSWTRRGLSTEGLSSTDTNALIRCTPADGANGFFVALFQLKKNDISSSSSSIITNISVPCVESSDDDDRKISNFENVASNGIKQILGDQQPNTIISPFGGDRKRKNVTWQHFSKRLKY